MKPRLPTAWAFDVHGSLKHAPPTGHGGIYLEVRPVSNYFRAGLQVDDQTARPGLPAGRWDAGVWAHRNTEAEAVAAVESLALAAGLVAPREG